MTCRAGRCRRRGRSVLASALTILKDGDYRKSVRPRRVLRLALAQLPRQARRRVLVRTDSGGGTHDFVAWLASPGRRLHYSVGTTITEDMQDAILTLPERGLGTAASSLASGKTIPATAEATLGPVEPRATRPASRGHRHTPTLKSRSTTRHRGCSRPATGPRESSGLV
jgi:hypothetical protein